jgi:hypothetical protein
MKGLSHMTDVFDALTADLRRRSEKEWELLIVADWPFYAVSSWPKGRHSPFAGVLPPEKWCKDVRSKRQRVMEELLKSGRRSAVDVAEARASEAASRVAIDAAGKWTDMLGLPMHVQAAKSVLWVVALHPELTAGQFRSLWDPYASVAHFLTEFEKAHLPQLPAGDPPAPHDQGLLARVFRRR